MPSVGQMGRRRHGAQLLLHEMDHGDQQQGPAPKGIHMLDPFLNRTTFDSNICIK